jgi:hypothetical protein
LQLSNECLAEEGFDLVGELNEGGGGTGVAEWNEEMGLVRAESAEFGYHGDPAVAYSEGFLSSFGAQSKESDWEVIAQCQMKSAEALRGGDEMADEKLPWEIKHAAEADATGDPDYIEAVSKWSACMAEDGHDYASPWEPWNDKRWAYPECDGTDPDCPTERPALSDIEVAVAKADVACKARVELVPIYRAAVWRSQTERIEANRPALEKRLELEKARVERAQEVLANAQ